LLCHGDFAAQHLSAARQRRPLQAKKLAGLDRYRVRQGDYRILYSIDDQALLVVVVAVGHRKDIYR